MADQVRIHLDQAAIAALAHTPEMRALIGEIGDRVADGARSGAPHRTGAGAASIRPQLADEPTGWVADITWDQSHHYMYYHEVGTRYLPARPFLAPALDRYARL
jgi:HK97 gp10 family phage protein